MSSRNSSRSVPTRSATAPTSASAPASTPARGPRRASETGRRATQRPARSQSSQSSQSSHMARRTPLPATPANETSQTIQPTETHPVAPALMSLPEAATEAAFRERVARLRDAACERARPQVKAGAAPIRVMARMVGELEAECRAEGVTEAILAREIVNRTIGDIDLRRVSACDDGPEFVRLADEMGLALPGEELDGYRARGTVYKHLRARMLDFERELLRRRIDLRIYDLSAIGNPLLREMLATFAVQQWGFSVPSSQIALSLGSLDGLDKALCGFAMAMRQAGHASTAILFPAPSFNVPAWQAASVGLRVHDLRTLAEDHFKVTPDQLRQVIAEAPDLRAFYLTVSNNPTAFAYTPDELRALFAVLTQAADHGRDVRVFADLAYIGTGEPAADRARMAVFNEPGVRERSILFHSLSKSLTFTGDRFGWVAFGDPALAAAVAPGWTNTIASQPADWQLRYMAVVEHVSAHPNLEERVRALYRHRRTRLSYQLAALNTTCSIFARLNLDDDSTIYNWSQLRPGEDVFSLFSATGIAGVPGSAFGYSDDYVRLSVGCIPVPAVE